VVRHRRTKWEHLAGIYIGITQRLSATNAPVSKHTLDTNILGLNSMSEILQLKLDAFLGDDAVLGKVQHFVKARGINA
jgi:hypothetical protein